jgi:hypothetical protein
MRNTTRQTFKASQADHTREQLRGNGLFLQFPVLQAVTDVNGDIGFLAETCNKGERDAARKID